MKKIIILSVLMCVFVGCSNSKDQASKGNPEYQITGSFASIIEDSSGNVWEDFVLKIVEGEYDASANELAVAVSLETPSGDINAEGVMDYNRIYPQVSLNFVFDQTMYINEIAFTEIRIFFRPINVMHETFEVGLVFRLDGVEVSYELLPVTTQVKQDRPKILNFASTYLVNASETEVFENIEFDGADKCDLGSGYRISIEPHRISYSAYGSYSDFVDFNPPSLNPNDYIPVSKSFIRAFYFESEDDVPEESGLAYDAEKPYVWIKSDYKLEYLGSGINSVELEVTVEYAEEESGPREKACHYKISTSRKLEPV